METSPVRTGRDGSSPDPAGSHADLRTSYQTFAREAGYLASSPTYERLAGAIADDDQLLERVATLPAPKRQPNLLLGAVRFLGGPVDDAHQFHQWTMRHWDEVAATVLARRTQTNEAGRAAVLLPVLASLPAPLALLEVGAAAGLCLYPDRFHYRYLRAGQEAGEPPHTVGDPQSPLRLSCQVSGPVPLPQRVPEVVWRAGVDLNPLDVTDEHDVRWLEALIWPDQPERVDRLRAGVDLARREPPQLIAGDLLGSLESVVALAPREATLVVFHSAVLRYLGDPQREAFTRRVVELPGHWVSNEGVQVLPGVAARLPEHAGDPAQFVMALDGRPVARTGPHGQSLDWF